MSSRRKNGVGFIYWSHDDSDSNSSSDESSDIFHSSKSNISLTESDPKHVGNSSEYEDLWRNLEKTTISDVSDDQNNEGPTEEYFKHPDILTDVQHRSSSQLPIWSSGHGIVHRESFDAKNPGFVTINRVPTFRQQRSISPETSTSPSFSCGKGKRFDAKNPVFQTLNRVTAFRQQVSSLSDLATKNQESKQPETSRSSFDFGLRQSKPLIPPFKPTSPREIIANRFIEQLENTERTGPKASASKSIPEIDRENAYQETSQKEDIVDEKVVMKPYSIPVDLFEIHTQNASQWSKNADEQLLSGKESTTNASVEDDAMDSLNIPSLGSSGKGQTRYLLEQTKPKISETDINPMMSSQDDSQKTPLSQNVRPKTQKFSNDQQFSDAESNSSIGPLKKAGAFVVPSSEDFWESPVQNPSRATLHKKSESSNNDFEVPISEDFWESPVKDSSGAFQVKSGSSKVAMPSHSLDNLFHKTYADLQKRSGNSKRSFEMPKSSDPQKSSEKDISSAHPKTKSGKAHSISELLVSCDDWYPVPTLGGIKFRRKPKTSEKPKSSFPGAHIYQKSGNLNQASKEPKSTGKESTVQDNPGSEYNLKTVSQKLGSLQVSSEIQDQLDLAFQQRILDSSVPCRHSTLNSLTGEVPTRLFVYDDNAVNSDSDHEDLEILNLPLKSRTEQLKQDEVSSMHSEYSGASSMCSYSSESASSLVPLNYDIIPNAQQTNVNIQNVNNLIQQQCIPNDGTDYLIRETDKAMEKMKLDFNFDISRTQAWKSVLETDKIVFLVGFSEAFKKLISLRFYQKYSARIDVFKLNSPKDWKTCRKKTEPFSIIMEDAFGPYGMEFERISHIIKNLSTFEFLEVALFMIDPLSFERNKESLSRCVTFDLAHYVTNLEDEEHLLSEDEKREILEKTLELVEKNGRSLQKEDIDKIVRFENPIFLDTCEEFIVFKRYDRNVLHFFRWPLDCLVGNIKYLKEKWPDGYYVLRLVAFHKVFDLSVKDGGIDDFLRQSIHGNLPQILNQFLGSYLEIQNNEADDFRASSNLSAPKYVFRHHMMQYAVLCTETDKAFLIKYCPVSFLVDVIAQMTNMREISIENKKRNIAKRFIQEILTGNRVASVVIHEIWNSDEFMEEFEQEWKTVEDQSIVSNLMSGCESNFLYLSVFHESPELLKCILKTIKEKKLKLPTLLFRKAIFATCVVGHFEHFELLMERIKENEITRFCKAEIEDRILIPRRNPKNSEIDLDSTKCYRTIIHTAVAFNRLDILDYLKRQEQNVNHTDSHGCTSLHVAYRSGSDKEIIEYLIQNNGDVAKVTDKSGNTCLHAACCRYDNADNVTSLVTDFPNLVLKRNAAGQTPLHTAAGAGNTQIVELLIEISNKYQKYCLSEKDSNGCTVLHLACKIDDNLPMVKFLSERQPSLITAQDHHGNTALHVACQTLGNTGVVEFLISKGLGINMMNSALHTPLHKACMADNVKVVRLLLGKDDIQISKDKQNRYPHQLTNNKIIRAKVAKRLPV